MIFFISLILYLADLLISAMTNQASVVLFTTWYTSSLFLFPRARAAQWAWCGMLLADLMLRGNGSFIALGLILLFQLSGGYVQELLKDDPLVYSLGSCLIAGAIVSLYPVAWTFFTIGGILGLPVIIIYNRV